MANGFLDWVGQGMQGLIAAAGHNYTYGTAGPPDDVLYAATGSHMDYCFEHAADRPSYTPEVRPAAGTPAWPPGTGFSGLPENEIEPTFKENLGAALAMINCAGHDNQAPPLNLNATTGIAGYEAPSGKALLAGVSGLAGSAIVRWTIVRWTVCTGIECHYHR